MMDICPKFDDKSPAYYAVVPASVRYDKELPANVKLLYAEITALSNAYGFCWSTNQYFADLYDVHKNTVSAWISLLTDKKYIRTMLIYNEGTKNVKYRLILIDALDISRYNFDVLNLSDSEKSGLINQINNRPIHDSNDTPINHNIDTPIHEIINTPINQNIKDNNININNTSNNITSVKNIDLKNDNLKPKKLLEGAKPKMNIKSFKLPNLVTQIDQYTCNITIRNELHKFLAHYKDKRRSNPSLVEFNELLMNLDILASNDNDKIKIIRNTIVSGWCKFYPLGDNQYNNKHPDNSTKIEYLSREDQLRLINQNQRKDLKF